MHNCTCLENGKEINLEDAKASLHYYPGLLQQKLEINGLKIEMKLIFVSNRESLLNATIINTSAKKRNLEIVWKGTSLLSSAHLYKTENGLLVKFSKNQHLFEINFYGKEKNNVLINESFYQIKSTIDLQPGGIYNSTQVHRYFLQPDEMPKKRYPV